jgi:hypothetical protein
VGSARREQIESVSAERLTLDQRSVALQQHKHSLEAKVR